MAPAAEDLLFGRIALHYKLVTREQLVEVSQFQASAGDTRRLGEILVEKGYLSQRHVAADPRHPAGLSREAGGPGPGGTHRSGIRPPGDGRLQARPARRPRPAPRAHPGTGRERPPPAQRRADQAAHARPPRRARCQASRRGHGRAPDPRDPDSRAGGRPARARGRSTSPTPWPARAASAATPTASSAASTPSSAPSRPSRPRSRSSACPTSLAKLRQLPPGHGAAHRPGRLRQVLDPGRAGQHHQPGPRTTTSSPSRIRSSTSTRRKGCVVNQRQVRPPHRLVRPRPARRPARGSGHHRHRRAARPGDHLAGAHRRRDRPPRARDAAHQQRHPHDQPHPRRLPAERSRTRSAPWSPSRCAPSSRQRLVRARRRQRPRAGARGAGRQQGRRQPDPREQDLPDPLRPADRRARTACACSTTRSPSWSSRG